MLRTAGDRPWLLKDPPAVAVTVAFHKIAPRMLFGRSRPGRVAVAIVHERAPDARLVGVTELVRKEGFSCEP
jgi:hypothetical protein